jgi:predicted DNA-binding protein (UPF0251 family)
LETISLWKDELEAIRLVYLENLTMQQGAEKMWVSAPTFNRIVNSGLKKLAEWIINLKAIKLDD